MEEALNEGTTISVKDRKTLTVEGVKDILAFDDTNLYVLTTLGRLNIDGEGLRIGELSVSGGTLTLEGRIDGLFFENSGGKKRAGLFGGKR